MTDACPSSSDWRHRFLTLVDFFALDPRLLHDSLVYLVHVDRKDVTVEDDEAGFETLGDLTEETLIRRKGCRSSRVKQHRLRHGERLILNNIGSIVGLPRYRSFDRNEDIVRVRPRRGRSILREADAVDVFVVTF